MESLFHYLKHKRNLVEDTGPLTESESEKSVSDGEETRQVLGSSN